MSELTKPLTELEKAELSVACDKVLTPAGMLLLRRAMFQLDRLVAENERLKSRLRKMHSVCTPENCILDGHPEHEEFFAEQNNDH